MPINCVVGDVRRAADEPPGVRRRPVEDRGPRREPVERSPRFPELLRVLAADRRPRSLTTPAPGTLREGGNSLSSLEEIVEDSRHFRRASPRLRWHFPGLFARHGSPLQVGPGFECNERGRRASKKDLGIHARTGAAFVDEEEEVADHRAVPADEEIVFAAGKPAAAHAVTRPGSSPAPHRLKGRARNGTPRVAADPCRGDRRADGRHGEG